MRYIICVIFFLTSIRTQSVAQRIDQAYFKGLEQASQYNRSDMTRIRALQLIAQYYNDRYYVDPEKTDLNKALDALESSIQISIRIKNDTLKIESIRLKASTFLAFKDTVNAISSISTVLNFFNRAKLPKKQIVVCGQFARAAYRFSFNNLCILYAKKGIDIAAKLHANTPILPLRIVILLAEDDAGDSIGTNRDLLKIIADYRIRNESLARIYYYVANKNRVNGDLKTGLNYAFMALKDVETFKDTLDSHNVYGEIALIYEALGKTEQSIFYFRKTLAARDRMLMPDRFKLRTLGFIIQGLVKLGRAKEGLAETTSYEALHPPLTNEGKAYYAQNKAYCYEALNNIEKAEQNYEQTILLLKGVDKEEILSLAYYDISKFYAKTGNFIKAGKYALQIHSTSLDTYKNYEYLHFKIDSATGNYHDAIKHFSNYQKAKDSLFNESKYKEISELQMKYETVQKENDIALLKKDAQLQRDQLKQSDHIRNVTLIGVILLLAAIALLYNSYRINIRKSREIDEKNLSLNGLIEEKEWLMKEIHHRVKNNLQIVMGLLQRQSSYIDNSAALKAIQNSEHRIHAIALIHQKLYQSEDLTLINMQEYIEELLGHLKETTAAENNILFNKDIDEIYLHVAQAVPLGLIINEAVTNAIKYAYPDNRQGIIRIVFTCKSNDQITLIIEDKGVGISDSINSKSMGMNLLRGLTKQLSGKFDITQTDGVSIQITFKNNHSEV